MAGLVTLPFIAKEGIERLIDGRRLRRSIAVPSVSEDRLIPAMIEQQDRAPRGGNRFKDARQQVLGDLFRSPDHLHAGADLDQDRLPVGMVIAIIPES